MMDVYHYTSEDNLRQIQRSGFIRESPLSNKDAFFGAGVYLTTMTPYEGRRKIAQNNWGHHGKYKEDVGNADCAIRLTIPHSNLRRAQSGDRDIWVHRGDVRLGDYDYIILRQGQEEGSWCTIL